MRRLRVAALSEVELAMDIINQAKAHLRAQGIDQWQTGYPDRDCLERDVRTGKGYFLEEDGIPLGYLCVDFDGEPAYDHLNGTWAREEPYVVVHRLALSDAARGRGDGAGPAHAEEVGNGGQHQKGGIGHSDGRGFMGGVQHPHKVGVRQIVDQRDHLTGHGRDYLQQHGLSDGCLRKDLQILFPVHIHSTCDS